MQAATTPPARVVARGKQPLFFCHTRRRKAQSSNDSLTLFFYTRGMQRPNYEQYGIQIEERGDTTHIFKDSELIGSFTIDMDTKTLRFQFPKNRNFNYFAYIASDLVTNRVKWVNESLKNAAMQPVEAGVAFLGFAKFEEMMRHDESHREIGSNVH